MSINKLRIGVIGAGSISDLHLQYVEETTGNRGERHGEDERSLHVLEAKGEAQRAKLLLKTAAAVCEKPWLLN